MPLSLGHRWRDERANLAARAFTLVELIVVISIIGIIATLVAVRLGTFAFWREEGAIRRLAETFTFLHYQSVNDQAYYRVEFDFENSTYEIGVIKPSDDADDYLGTIAADTGALTLELAAFLSPALGRTQTVIPPPSFPSLAEPVQLPSDSTFSEIRTMRGKHTRGDGVKPYLIFSPRGFSEFGVIHIKLGSGGEVTILINPFTGNTTIYRGYKDFEWSYGKKKDS